MAIRRCVPALFVVLAVGAVAFATPELARASHAAGAWPAVARTTARSVAAHWSANVPATARLGAEPPGRCRRLDGRHAACPIAIVVLASDAKGQRPWRCSATVIVSRKAGRLAAKRTGTRCAPFPPPAAVPDPAAALGTAYALRANGDVACRPASDGRVTCAMTYRRPSGQRCVGAASVSVAHPVRSVALGAPVCR